MEWLSSKPFTFLLGHQKRPLVVHSGLFKNISDPLYARTPDSGKWQQNEDTIEDIEWEVFAALVEYAYTGDYKKSLLERVRLDDVEAAGSRPPANPSAGPHPRTQPTSLARRDSCTARGLVFSFGQPETQMPLSSGTSSSSLTEYKPVFVSERKIAVPTSPPPEGSIQASLWLSFLYTEPLRPMDCHVSKYPATLSPKQLLYHAEVCVAAQRYLIMDLKTVAMYKLHRALTIPNELPGSMASAPRALNAFLDLLHYVYLEEGVEAVPALKNMVLAYAAAKSHLLRSNQRLREMMRDNGNIGVDLLFFMSGGGHRT